MDPYLFDLSARIEETHWWFAARRSVLQSALKAAGLAQGGLVLDVGCGTGGNLASLAADHRCVGVDPSVAAIEHARRRFPGIDYRVGQAPGDVADVLADADAVMLMDVLEHVEDDRGLLMSIVEPMRPGALVLVTVPADMRLWSQHDVSNGHFRRYELDELRAIWDDLPVATVAASPFNARLYPVVRVVRSVTRRFARAAGEGGSDLARLPRPINALLRSVFGGERRRIVRVITSGGRPYRRGVSLLAVLRRR